MVTVCDDGGSSGRLRRDLRVLPPGDFRQCIAALADSDPLVTALFEHRFAEAPDGQRHDLAGHAFGNLYIAAMAQITGLVRAGPGGILAGCSTCGGGSCPRPSRTSSSAPSWPTARPWPGRACIPERAQPGAGGHGHGEPPAAPAGTAPPARRRGRRRRRPGHAARCRPWTAARRAPLQSAHPDARPAAGRPADDGSPDLATVAATGGNPIQRVFLEPAQPPVYPEVVRALLDADLIVIGPGSLYTSILPNLLVGDLARALCWSRAAKVYVCNVATQPGETDGYSVAAHVRAIRDHLDRAHSGRASPASPSPTCWSTPT